MIRPQRRTLSNRQLMLVLSVSLNGLLLVGSYLVWTNPYFTSDGLTHYRTQACGRDESYILSHSAVSAQRYFRVAMCNEGLREDANGNYMIGPPGSPHLRGQ